MKKTSKIVFLVVLLVILMLTFSVTVKAADAQQTQVIDVTEYEDLDATTENSGNKNETTTTEGTKTETTTTENKTQETDKATTSHPQAGVFTSYITIAIVAISLLVVVAYTKLKKYKF